MSPIQTNNFTPEKTTESFLIQPNYDPIKPYYSLDTKLGMLWEEHMIKKIRKIGNQNDIEEMEKEILSPPFIVY